MLGLNSRWGRKRFAVRALISLASYIAASFAAPFVFEGLVHGLSCSSGSGECLVPGLIYAGFMPVIFWVFFLSLVPPLVGRLCDIGLSPWLCLFVLLLVGTDSTFLAYAPLHWPFASSNGVIGSPPPIFALEALAMMLVLAVVPARASRVTMRTVGWPAWPAVVLAVLVAAAAIERMIGSLYALRPILAPVTRFLGSSVLLGRYALWLLPAAAAFALWPRAGQSVEAEVLRERKPRIPLLRLAAVAIALAALLTIWSFPTGLQLMVLFMLPALLGVSVLPNAGLFFAVLLAGYLWVKRRSWIAALLTVAVIGVYSTWGYEHYLSANVEAIDAREVAAIETYKPTSTPRVILLSAFGATFTDFLHLLLERSDVDTVVTSQKGQLVGYRWPTWRDVLTDPELAKPNRVAKYAIDELPDPHLVLNTSNSSSFYRRGYLLGEYEAGGPYELRLVEGTADRLVAVWYRRRPPTPFWFPILTSDGWKRDETGGAHLDWDSARRDFLVSALGEVPIRSAAERNRR